MPDKEESALLENVRIVFRNFAGKAGTYNREGDRNFYVLLNDDVAKAMEEDGWNVKWLRPREEGDEPQGSLPISIKFNRGRPPRVVIVSSRGRTTLTENELEILDWADISNVDLTIRPHHWTVGEKTGTKAYLKTMFVTIIEDELELKYADLDDIPARGGKTHE